MRQGAVAIAMASASRHGPWTQLLKCSSVDQPPTTHPAERNRIEKYLLASNAWGRRLEWQVLLYRLHSDFVGLLDHFNALAIKRPADWLPVEIAVESWSDENRHPTHPPPPPRA